MGEAWEAGEQSVACNVRLAPCNYSEGCQDGTMRFPGCDHETEGQVGGVFGMVRLGCNCPDKVWGRGTQLCYEANGKLSSDLLLLVHVVHRVIWGIEKVRLASPRIH